MLKAVLPRVLIGAVAFCAALHLFAATGGRLLTAAVALAVAGALVTATLAARVPPRWAISGTLIAALAFGTYAAALGFTKYPGLVKDVEPTTLSLIAVVGRYAAVAAGACFVAFGFLTVVRRYRARPRSGRARELTAK